MPTAKIEKDINRVINEATQKTNSTFVRGVL
jgi:hypothetical protein